MLNSELLLSLSLKIIKKNTFLGQRFAMMEEKVILANILRKFEIKSLKSLDELQPLVEMILKPSTGIPIKLKIREKNF
jgi:cytochrome P450